ncbi:MAG: SCO family protein [Acetobacteraceae bacterium]|nr:SCO family protein [Acetobacteraceae bacterium]
MARLMRALVVVLFVAGMGLWANTWWQEEKTAQQSAVGAGGVAVPGGVAIGGHFDLVGADGKPVTDADFRGKVMLVYFGYTFCPDVCPTELQTIAASLAQLGDQAAKVAPIFITIDPERDTPQAMGEYVKLFDGRIVGLTGSAEQIASVAKAYRVYYAKADAKGASTYLMDHSSFIYVMGPDGGFRSLIKPGAQAADVAQALRAQLPHS